MNYSSHIQSMKIELQDKESKEKSVEKRFQSVDIKLSPDFAHFTFINPLACCCSYENREYNL